MKVLIAVDSSETAEKAFDWYITNCHKTENEVVVCHAMEKPNFPNSSYTMMGSYFPTEEVQAVLHEHHKKWKALQNHYREKCEKIEKLKFEVRFEHATQKPGVEIVKMAESLKVDMIVTGTRGQGLFRRTLLGSVSEYVLHHAKIPVVIVH